MNINIELKNLEIALNEYNKDIISENLDNYLIYSLNNQKLINKNIIINIKGIYNKEEQEHLKNVLINYYQNKTSFFNKIDSVDNIIRFILGIVGAIIILISHEFNFLLSELFLIAGWVIIWEIVYDLLFNEIKRKRKKKVYSKLSSSIITFNE